MAAIDVVFFDIGGVVLDADLERYIQVGCAMFKTNPQALMREVGARVPLLEVGRMDSSAFWKEIGETLWRAGQGRIADESEYTGLWRRLMHSSLRIDANVGRICKALDEYGVRVGVLSNAIEEHAQLLTELGIYRPFNPVIVSCRVGMRKPDPNIYRLAARSAGVRPEQCLFVDDLPENVVAAEREGMTGIHFTGAEALYGELVRRRLFSSRRAR